MNALEPPAAPPSGFELEAPNGFLIRPARPEDADSIHRLVEAVSRVSTVLPRTRESILGSIGGFVVAERRGEVAGCGALHSTGDGLGEIRSLAVDARFRSRGLGAAIVAELVDLGRRLDLWRLFVLTDSVEFFRRRGFAETGKETLPHKVWNDCLQCPKLFNCGEIAMDMTLRPAPPPAVSQDGPGWPLED